VLDAPFTKLVQTFTYVRGLHIDSCTDLTQQVLVFNGVEKLGRD